MRSQIFQRPNVVIVRSLAWAIATQFVTIGLLVSCNDITNDRAKKSTNQNLIGTWEFKNQDGAKTGTAIFEPKSDADGNVYILSNDSPSGKTAIAGKYKVNSSSNPQQLDLIVNSQLPSLRYLLIELRDLLSLKIFEINFC